MGDDDAAGRRPMPTASHWRPEFRRSFASPSGARASWSASTNTTSAAFIAALRAAFVDEPKRGVGGKPWVDDDDNANCLGLSVAATMAEPAFA